ncbi:DnaJ-related protein spj1 [Cyphellophora attinorum]|uniref:DnaJ-related protein spj1 n=1 Tax=Cyphellophora attinorum TaxID=1664694 RepID=A0A0N1HGC3_9EURO|nr:DnaJ-related protein spj1 [Phialophora attinorum]KPI45192.1 DnaJ-related protein spj1 [Phialophora attinorum]
MLVLPLLQYLVPFVAFLALAIAAPEDFYKILGVDRSCDDRDLKKAYRTLSKKYHPDKSGGDEKKFLEVAEAYEALSDSTTRKVYDQYGHDGLAQHKNGGGRQQGHDPFDLFSRFFGGGGHAGGGGGVRRGNDMDVRLTVPLSHFYTGGDTDFTLEKQGICDDCEGSGSADGQVETCSKCGGRGAIVQKHMLAPGIFQQVQMQCDQCGGQGKSIKHKCKTCGGAKVVRRQVSLTASVEKGMPKGSKLVFENEADEHPDYVAGNLNVYLSESEPQLAENDEHRTDGTFFRRKDQDLYWKEVLSLREAWMGDWSRNLTHLDGHIVHLSRKRGEVIQPGQVESVPKEGMPTWQEGHVHEHDHDVDEFGKLYVEYVVVLPDQMESGMEKEFHAVWEKWRKKSGIDLHKDSGRPAVSIKDEL